MKICAIAALWCLFLPVPAVAQAELGGSVRAVEPNALDQAIAAGELRYRRGQELASAELERRLALEGYDRMHQGTESFSAEDRALVGEGSFLLSGGAEKGDFFAQFREEAMRNHPEPQFRAWYWSFRQRADPRDKEALAAIKALIVEMTEGGGSPLRILGLGMEGRKLLINIIEDMPEAEQPEANRQMNEWYFEIVARAAAIENLDTVGRRYIWNKALSVQLSAKQAERRNACLAALRAQPGVDPWILQAAEGAAMIEDAWDARGSAFAYKTTSEQFEAFHQGLDTAIAQLEKAYEIDPMCPEVPKYLIVANMPRSSTWEASGWDWFYRALAAEIDYAPVWDKMLYALEPKWQGGLEQKFRLCEFANNPDLYHTRLPLQALYLFDDLDIDLGHDLGIEGGAYSEQRLVRAATESLEGMIKAGANIDKAYARTALAYIYWQTGEKKKAGDHLRAINGRTSQYAHNLLSFQDEHLASMILPHVSASADQAASAEAFEAAGDWAAALAAWQIARSACVDIGDTLAAEAIDERILRAERQARLDAGEWVTLDFKDGWAGWRPTMGDWTIVDDGAAVEARVGGTARAVLAADLFPGDAFEYEVDVEIIGDVAWKSTTAGAMFHRGNRVLKKDVIDRMAMVWPYWDTISLSESIQRIKHYRADCPAPADNIHHIRVEVDDPWCKATINGVTLGDDVLPDHRPGQEGNVRRIGLAAYSLGDGVHAKFTNIRVRKRKEPVEFRF